MGKGAWKQERDNLGNLMRKHNRDSWIEYGYRFLFREGRYFWKERELEITVCQAVYLYHRLVLGTRHPPHPQAIYTLRVRYGNDFLKEAIPCHSEKKRKGRRSDLEREVDGSYYRKYLRREQ